MTNIIIGVLVVAVAVLGGYVAGLVRNPRRHHASPPPPPAPLDTDADDALDERVADAVPADDDASFLDDWAATHDGAFD